MVNHYIMNKDDSYYKRISLLCCDRLKKCYKKVKYNIKTLFFIKKINYYIKIIKT